MVKLKVNIFPNYQKNIERIKKNERYHLAQHMYRTSMIHSDRNMFQKVKHEQT